jgi:sporulation protein YlmC with PRC-barrel domain
MMTGKVLTLGCMLVMFFVAGAFGEPASVKPDGASLEKKQTDAATTNESFIGKSVESKDGKDLGQVKKIVKSPANGQTYAIIVFANKLYPVPVTALSAGPEKEKLALGIDKNKFNTAPSYPEDKLPDMNSPAINGLINKFYDKALS